MCVKNLKEKVPNTSADGQNTIEVCYSVFDVQTGENVQWNCGLKCNADKYPCFFS